MILSRLYIGAVAAWALVNGALGVPWFALVLIVGVIAAGQLWRVRYPGWRPTEIAGTFAALWAIGLIIGMPLQLAAHFVRHLILGN